MSNKDKTIEPFAVEPFVPGYEEDFIIFCKKVSGTLADSYQSLNSEKLRNLRNEVTPQGDRLPVDNLRFLLAANLMIDFASQGWSLHVTDNNVLIVPPVTENNSKHASKEKVRQGHLLARDEQLCEPSVAEFVRGMEKRRLTSTGWHSIFSLMRDGRELAVKLKDAALITDKIKRQQQLATIISPYIEFVEPEKTCSHTGLFLQDIWRYFRHTWVNAYQSLPGRSIQILIRDAAGPNHPVIGIAALGSAVVQQTVRDVWIGWDAEICINKLDEYPSDKYARWLLLTLENLISAIYTDDIEVDGLCTHLDTQYPTQSVIDKLLKESQRTKDQHRRFPKAAKHKRESSGSNGEIDWEQQARTNLFRSKRCSTLAALLSIRKVFQETGFNKPSKSALRKAVESSAFRTAAGQLVRLKKAERVGIDMMDIIVCGAIAPYNSLLGGKLVCMLMCSPEIIQYYSKRYGDQASIIASSMKGQPVIRKPQLVYLGTTSLYGVGSSQYNRIQIPAGELGGKAGEKVEYKQIGWSDGYGSYHLSKVTNDLIKNLLSRKQDGRRVNFIFGEGTNPKMRHIRDALAEIKLPSDSILMHGRRRVVYGVKLAKNFRDILLGIVDRPSYIIPQQKPQYRTERLASYWTKRWLSQRIENPEVLNAVSEHTLVYPITHGAKVPLPKEESAQLSLFEM